MSKKEYIRKCKEENPVVAICYDFDNNLSFKHLKKLFFTFLI